MARHLIVVCCLLLLSPFPAQARVGSTEHWKQEKTVRDLSAIRTAGVLRVLVNQNRNSSGELDGKPIGIEYRRLDAFEQYLNAKGKKAQPLKVCLLYTSPSPRD